MDSYIQKKIDHLKRIGIGGRQGMNSGACPDWLYTEQEAAAKARQKNQGKRR